MFWLPEVIRVSDEDEDMSHKKQTMDSFLMLRYLPSYSIIYGMRGRTGSFLLYLFLEGPCVLFFTVK